MKFNIVVSVNNHNLIGENNDLLIHSKKDLRNFQKITTEGDHKNILIMGYNTFSYKQTSLKNRINIVITNNDYENENEDKIIYNNQNNDLHFVNSLNEAITFCNNNNDIEQIFIIGGENIYKKVLHKNTISKLYVIYVDEDILGNRYFNNEYEKYYTLLDVIKSSEESNLYFKTYKRKSDEIQYLDLISNVLENGVYKNDRTNSGILSYFGNQMRFNIEHSFPLLTTKKMFLRGIIEELLWFINGETDAKLLQAKKVRIWDGNSSREVIVKGAGRSNNFMQRSQGGIIITGQKGIFPNDGEAVYELPPIFSFPLSSFQQKFITEGTLLTENNNGNVRTFALTEPTAGSDAETNGWTYVANFDNGDPDEYWYYDEEDEGLFGIGSDPTTDADDPTNWDISEVFYNETTEVLQDIQAGGRYESNPLGQYLRISGQPENTKLGIQKVGFGYGNTKMGWVRNQLYQGRSVYPLNPDAHIQANQPTGFDIMFNIRDNPDFDGIIVNLSQMNKNGGIEFPNPNWRNLSKYVFQNKTPSNWNTIAGTNPAPTPWANFNYGQDHIQLKVQISNINNMKIFILHDKNGDGNWEEQQMLITMAQAGNNITKNIVEDFFPLRPCFTMINGGRYDKKIVKVSGRYDEQENNPPVGYEFSSGKAGYEEMDDTNPNYQDVSLTADPPTNAVKLGATMIWGNILDEDLVSNGGTLPDAEVPTPASRLVNQIAPLIGYNRFNVYPSGNVSNPTKTQHKPQLSIREPNLLVELVDFNIKGYNGTTGDRGKIIASIPAEELSTNSRTGTLNYFSQYPIMIDLNLVNDIVVYDLNVIIRRPNGQVADDLVQSTALTLLFKEGEETKQRRMLREQAELIASSMSNINQIKTDSVGNGFPKL